MKSYWKQTQIPKYSILNQDIKCNICIVGAGLHGIVLAYLLQEHHVILVDQADFLHGASSMNTGKLTSQHSDCYHKLIRKHGIQIAKEYYLHNQMAIEKVKEWHKEFNFTLNSAETLLCTKNNHKILEKEYRAYQLLDIPSTLTKHTLSMHNQYQFHPTELATALLHHMPKVACYQDTPILRYENNETNILFTPKHTITANIVIFTNHLPILPKEYLLFMRYKAYTSYLLMKPYHYHHSFNILNLDNQLSFRTLESQNKQYLLIAGQDHRFGIPNENSYQKLHEQTQKLSSTIYQQWQNHDYTTYDLLPFIGDISNNIYISFGFNLWGNTWSIASSLLLYNKIIHNIDQLSAYHPKRIKDIFTLQCLNNNTETIYYLIKYYFIHFYKKPNGSIITFQNKKYGYYQDTNNTILIHIHCPHLGCILQYNHQKQTWDCPCHASSFTYNGTRICGPTSKNLEHIIIKK